MDQKKLKDWVGKNEREINRYHREDNLTFEVIPYHKVGLISAIFPLRDTGYSKYYVAWIDTFPGKCPFWAWIRLSDHWGEFKKRKTWELEEGKLGNDGEYVRDQQMGYIPIDEKTGRLSVNKTPGKPRKRGNYRGRWN